MSQRYLNELLLSKFRQVAFANLTNLHYLQFINGNFMNEWTAL